MPMHELVRLVYDKLVSALRLPSVAGTGLSERMRSTSFALLGLTAAAGLALVAIFAQPGFTVISPAPLPDEPSIGESVSEAQRLPSSRRPVALVPARPVKSQREQPGGSAVDTPSGGSPAGSSAPDQSQPAPATVEVPAPAAAPGSGGKSGGGGAGHGAGGGSDPAPAAAPEQPAASPSAPPASPQPSNPKPEAAAPAPKPEPAPAPGNSSSAAAAEHASERGIEASAGAGPPAAAAAPAPESDAAPGNGNGLAKGHDK